MSESKRRGRLVDFLFRLLKEKPLLKKYSLADGKSWQKFLQRSSLFVFAKLEHKGALVASMGHMREPGRNRRFALAI